MPKLLDRCRHPGCDKIFKNQGGVRKHMKKCKCKPREVEYVSRQSIYRSIGKEIPSLLKSGSSISAIVETANEIASIVEEGAEMIECNFNDNEENAEIERTGNTSYETKMHCGEEIYVPQK